MADNTQLPVGGAGDTVRDIDRAGIKTQVVILDMGGQAGPESLATGTVPISAASLPLPTGAATSGKQDTIITALGSPLQAGGAVSVSNFPASVEVANDAGNPLAVNGTVTANQGAAPWAENVTQFGGTNLSTGTGTGGAGIPRVTVSSDSFPTSQAVIGATGVQTSGNIAGTGQIVGPVTLNGATRVTILQSGTYAGVSVIAEVSMDAGFVVATSVRPVRISSIFLEAGSTYTLGTNATQGNIVDVGGWAYFRLRCTAYTSGTLAVVLVPSFPSTSLVMDAVASGTAANGGATTGLPVWVAGSDGSNVRALLTDNTGQLIVNQGVANATPWAQDLTRVGGVAVSTGVGVGGTGIPRVTVSRDSQVNLWDGTNQATVKAAGAPPGASDTALVVAMSPNSPVPDTAAERSMQGLLQQLVAQAQNANANLGLGFFPQETPAFLGGF